MTSLLRALLPALVIVVFAACDSSTGPTDRPTSTPAASATATQPASAGPQESPSAEPVAQTDLRGEWFCYGYQPSVGSNSANVSGVIGGNSLLGSFTIQDETTYESFFGADSGTYRADPTTGAITFESGSMVGLEGTTGAGLAGDLIDLHGVGNGWDDPFVVYLACDRS